MAIPDKDCRDRLSIPPYLKRWSFVPRKIQEFNKFSEAHDHSNVLYDHDFEQQQDNEIQIQETKNETEVALERTPLSMRWSILKYPKNNQTPSINHNYHLATLMPRRGFSRL